MTRSTNYYKTKPSLKKETKPSLKQETRKWLTSEAKNLIIAALVIICALMALYIQGEPPDESNPDPYQEERELSQCDRNYVVC